MRPDAVRARLLRLEEVISQLAELGRLDPDALRGNLRDAWAAERGLQLGPEIVFDVGNHLLSAHFGVTAEGYEDIVAQLAGRGVLSAELRHRLRGLAGFRNILVHDYLRLDPDKVREALAKAPTDFSDFSAAVRKWLEVL